MNSTVKRLTCCCREDGRDAEVFEQQVVLELPATNSTGDHSKRLKIEQQSSTDLKATVKEVRGKNVAGNELNDRGIKEARAAMKEKLEEAERKLATEIKSRDEVMDRLSREQRKTNRLKNEIAALREKLVTDTKLQKEEIDKLRKELQNIEEAADRNSHDDVLKRMLVDYRRRIVKLERGNEKMDELQLFQVVAKITRERERQGRMTSDCGTSNKLKANDAEQCKSKTTESDHISRLRELYEVLAEKIEAKDVASRMYECNALTLSELEKIQSSPTTSGAETLLNILLKAPREVFGIFLDALRHTNQEHIFLQIQCPDASLKIEHCQTIRQHYVYLLDNLDTKFSMVTARLHATGVLSPREKEDIEVELTSTRQNEKLLSALGRKSAEQWELFLTALDNTGQGHIRKHITGHTDADGTRITPEVDNSIDGEITLNKELSREVEQLKLALAEVRKELEEEKAAKTLEEIRRQQESSADKPISQRSKSAAVLDKRVEQPESLPKRSMSQPDAVRFGLESQRFNSGEFYRRTECVSVPTVRRAPVFTLRGKTNPVNKEVRGVCILNSRLYVAHKALSTIDIHDVLTLTKLSEELDLYSDYPGYMAACSINKCLYISFYRRRIIQKINVDNKHSEQWEVESCPDGVSVTASTNIIVALREADQLLEFNSEGRLLFRIKTAFPSPRFALGFCDDKYLACFGLNDHKRYDVRLIDKSGNSIQKINISTIHPVHLAVGCSGCVLVADYTMNRLTVLDSNFVVAGETDIDAPFRLCFNETCDRLYVGEHEGQNRVLVFDVTYR